ncbi:hypothetical protein ACS5PY_004238 [Vibrio vulnificus]
MTESQNKWFKNWASKRQKGAVYYIITQTLIISGGLFLGKFAGFALFTNQNRWGEFLTELPTTVMLLLAIGIPFNVISWFLGEWRYRKLSDKQNIT